MPLHKSGADRVAAERQRQITEEGWTPEHDNAHKDADLAVSAAALAVDGTDAMVFDPLGRGTPGYLQDPNDPESEQVGDRWGLIAKHGHKGEKPNRTRALTLAGALIAAEIDRLNRLQDDQTAADR